MAGIIIKAFSSATIGKLSDFFHGKVQVNPAEIFSIFAKAASQASVAAKNIPQFSKQATALSYLSKYLVELSNDINSIKGSGGGGQQGGMPPIWIGGMPPIIFGGKTVRQVERTVARKMKKLEARQKKRLLKIKQRQERKRARKMGNLEIAGEKINRAKELGIDPEINTFLGFIGGHGSVKPSEIFDTIGQLTTVISETLKKFNVGIGNKVDQYGTEIMNKATELESEEGAMEQATSSVAAPAASTKISSTVSGSGPVEKMIEMKKQKINKKAFKQCVRQNRAPGLKGPSVGLMEACARVTQGQGGKFSDIFRAKPKVKKKDYNQAFYSCVDNLRKNKGKTRKGAISECRSAMKNYISASANYDPEVVYGTIKLPNIGKDGAGKKKRVTKKKGGSCCGASCKCAKCGGAKKKRVRTKK